jgi:hypothetical protein
VKAVLLSSGGALSWKETNAVFGWHIISCFALWGWLFDCVWGCSRRGSSNSSCVKTYWLQYMRDAAKLITRTPLRERQIGFEAIDVAHETY